VDLILEIVTTLVAAIMVDEIAQVAVADVAAVVVVAVVAIVAVVVAEAEMVAVVATVAVVVAEAEMVAVVAIVAVNVMVAVMVDVTVTDQTIRKVVADRITKENRVIPTRDLTEVTVQKGKRSHSKGDQKSAAEVIEAVELAIVDQTIQYILTPMLHDRSI
jgi:hypothetical protein